MIVAGLSFAVSSRSAVNLLDLWLAYSIAALGFYWAFALGGRFAFCQTFMMAVGGYSLAWLSRHGIPFGLAVLGATALTAAVAAVVGLLLWRTEHLYFALGTLAVTEIGLLVFSRTSSFTGTNGNVTSIDYPEIFGMTLRTDGQMFYLLAAALLLLLLLAVLIERSPLIRQLHAVRVIPVVARSTGVPVGGLRMTMFIAGSAVGGLSGALITGWQGFIGVDSFGLDLGIGLFLMVILGGVSSHWGVMLGAAFYVAVPELLSGVQQYMTIIYGALLLLIVLLFPEGLIGIWHRLSAARARSSSPGGEQMSAASGTDLVEVSDLRVSFGGVRAVAGVSFSVRYGEIFGLVGPNGSGKTTLLNALTGVVRASGELRVDARSVQFARPESFPRRAGLARVYQAPQLVPELTCVENVLLGAADRANEGLAAAWLGRPMMWRHERSRLADAYGQLDRVGLANRGAEAASRLTYGDQRLLELARALAAHPKVLMLDEPSAGLNDQETDALATILLGVRSDQTTLLLVDHKIDVIDQLCDRVLVLELGQRIALGSPAEVWADERVMDAYLGVENHARGS